jgi:hypothetical protein
MSCSKKFVSMMIRSKCVSAFNIALSIHFHNFQDILISKDMTFSFPRMRNTKYVLTTENFGTQKICSCFCAFCSWKCITILHEYKCTCTSSLIQLKNSRKYNYNMCFHSLRMTTSTFLVTDYTILRCGNFR